MFLDTDARDSHVHHKLLTSFLEAVTNNDIKGTRPVFITEDCKVQSYFFVNKPKFHHQINRILPAVIFRLQNLKHLKMDDNIISILPQNWQHLDIVTFSLKNNPIMNIDHLLDELPCITNLNLQFFYPDIDLLTVSKYITNERELQDIGVQLGLRFHEIDSIITNHRDDINQAACEVLRIWRENSGDRTAHGMKHKLKDVLKKVGVPIDYGIL